MLNLRPLVFLTALIVVVRLAASVETDSSPQAEFGKQAILASGVDCVVKMEIVADDPELLLEGFRIKASSDQITITALDSAGLMYGGLEVAELLATGGLDAVADAVQNPYMQMRGSKLNIPLGARVPTYTSASDVAQANIPAMWEFEFWEAYIDEMASHRYNFISLWSLHPFTSLVRVPGYEEAALDDVWRSRTLRKEENYHLHGTGLVTPEILEDAEIVREMSIDEKIAFWRKVMAYGKSRNVDFYFITWNVFTDSLFGKYGITDSVDNEITRDYFRKSVKEMFVTYPDLKGIGLTTGENMRKVPFETKEDWAFATYGQGVLDAAEAFPEREIRFVHRQHFASPEVILEKFKPLIEKDNIDFIFSFKYAKAHVYSSVEQHYHPEFVENLEPTKVKTIWTLRNDDTYYFRWGAPDFVRTFIKNIPISVTQGMYFGSDQWIWGREFLHREGPSQGELEIQKHDYQWMLWGRLSYDPEFSNERIQKWLAEHYGIETSEAATLFEAWQSASMVYPMVTGFHWGALDFQWYIEACQSRTVYSHNETGFHDVNRFITLPPHPMTDYQSIPDFVAGENENKVSPFEAADAVERSALVGDLMIDKLDTQKGSDLERTKNDIKIVSLMGRYYANKIRGATELALFRETEDDTHRVAAVAHLTMAARDWKAYTEAVLEHYRNPLWTNRVGEVDLKQNYQYALDDVRLAGGDPEGLGLEPEITGESISVERPWEKL